MARTILLLLVSGLFATGCAKSAPESEPAEPPAPRPHILLISLDACRADHLGCYGHDRPTSPFIDHLAASGTRFAHAFVNTHGTPPSHTTMLSSLYQESHGVQLAGLPPAGQIERIPASVVMVQEILRGAGYITVGATGGGNMSSAIGFGDAACSTTSWSSSPRTMARSSPSMGACFTAEPSTTSSSTCR